MDGTRCAKVRLWRWRYNPLRRREDIVEGWVVLAVWLLMLVGGTVLGLATARNSVDAFDEQRADRRPTHAVLQADVPESAKSVGAASDLAMGTVRWTTDDGTTHTDETLVDRGSKAGTEVVVWVDGTGELATEPPDRTEAVVEAAVLGTGAGLALAGAVYGTGKVIRWRLERRRVARWGQEWELVEPEWRRKTG
ncbi:Rv1733c family protein [Streptomyces sp. NPDC054829]